MLNLELIGNKITKHRKLLGFTQAKLADTIYVTHQAVSKWENGKSIPSIEILISLTSLFDITIDYLLDNTEIKEGDYKTLFAQLPRDTVLNKYLNSDCVNSDLKNIFYLLDPTERELVINRIIANTIDIKIEILWPYLNNEERLYLLSVILSNKLNYDLAPIYHLLSNEERIICSKQIKNGTYNYILHTSIYIRS
ncbi:MAG: helix-turn-helix transcriptional regulator [Candidatus Izimaplasma sp.]|nr:helix-turn-helix transcriptional regulator [Candidatus Izimaplasma bacterium]